MEQKQKVYEMLDKLKISYTVIEHPAAYTIEDLDALEEIKDNPWVAKNLFLRDEKGRRHFLVLIDKNKMADTRSIRAQLGSTHLSFASEERLMRYLKLTKGSVTPMGIINDENHAVEVVFDRDLVGRERIGVHPNDNTATVIMSYHDLYNLIRTHGNTVHIIDL